VDAILVGMLDKVGNVFIYSLFFNGGFELIFQLLHQNLAEVGHFA
jgi:hypothetical protein